MNKSLSVILPSFGAHIPDADFDRQEQNIYPTAIRTPDGFDLDYSNLLFANKIILDISCKEFVESSKRPHLLPMRESMNCLSNEGFIDFIDYKSIIESEHDNIRKITTKLLGDIDHWRPLAAEHWKQYRAEIPELLARYGNTANAENEELHFGVYCYLQKYADKIDYVEGAKLNKFVASKAKLKSEGERSLLRELIAPILHHAVSVRVLRKKLAAPFVDWNDLDIFYSQIKNFQVANSLSIPMPSELPTEAEKVFSLAFPNLKPENAMEVARFLKSSDAVESFRNLLIKLKSTDKEISSDWATKFRDNANLAQLISRRQTRRLSWVLFPLKLTLLPGAEPLVSMLIDTAAGGSEIGSQDVLHSNAVGEYEWYYTLLEVKNDSS